MLVPLGLLLLTISAANVALGLGLRADDRGVTDRVSFRLVQVGQTEAQVLDLLGSAPLATSVITSGHGSASCLTYRRRSAGTWLYRFCFGGGILKSKSELVPRA